MDLNVPIVPGIDAKADSLIPGDFSGNPKKAVVTFMTPFEDANYVIVFSPLTDGTKSFAPAAESKTAAGFVLNLNSNNVANLIEIGWQAMKVGE